MEDINSKVKELEKKLLSEYRDYTGNDLLEDGEPKTYPVYAFQQGTLTDLLCEYFRTVQYTSPYRVIQDIRINSGNSIVKIPCLGVKYIDLGNEYCYNSEFAAAWRKSELGRVLRYMVIAGDEKLIFPITSGEFKEIMNDAETEENLQKNGQYGKQHNELFLKWRNNFEERSAKWNKGVLSPLPGTDDFAIEYGWRKRNNIKGTTEVKDMRKTIVNEMPEGHTAIEAIKQEENKTDNRNCAGLEMKDANELIFTLFGYPDRSYPELKNSDELIHQFRTPVSLDNNNETKRLHRLDITIYERGISFSKPDIHPAVVYYNDGITFHWVILSDDEVKWLEDKEKEINDFIDYQRDHNPDCVCEDMDRFDDFKILLYDKLGIKDLREVLAEKIYNGNGESGIPLPEVPADQQENLKAFRATIEEMYSLYKKKNSDYTANNKMGSAFEFTYNLFGLTAPGVRLADKFIRYVALTTGKEQQVKNESVEDTLIDMANYAVMTLMEIRKGKNKQ